jgi:hypothetical protein
MRVFEEERAQKQPAHIKITENIELWERTDASLAAVGTSDTQCDIAFVFWFRRNLFFDKQNPSWMCGVTFQSTCMYYTVVVAVTIIQEDASFYDTRNDWMLEQFL